MQEMLGRLNTLTALEPEVRARNQSICINAMPGSGYGTYSMRRTKAKLIDRRTKNLRAVQLLLGYSNLESTVRYLNIEVDDTLEISEHTEI